MSVKYDAFIGSTGTLSRHPPSELSTTASDISEQEDLVLTDAPNPTTSVKLEGMSKQVLFYGKPTQIDDVITHCTVTFAATGITDSHQQAGYLASTFRGNALSWLTEQLRQNKGLLDNYTDLESALKDAFALTDTATQGIVARQLTNIRQRKSAQDYALDFTTLATKANLPDETATALFIRGLKPHIQRSLVTLTGLKRLEDHIDAAVRIDSELFNIQAATGKRGKGSGYPARNKKNGQYIKKE